MIDDGQVDRLGGPDQRAGCAIVRLAWSRIAAWVIVSENDTGAPKPGGVRHDRANWQDGGRIITAIAFQVNALCRFVDMGHPYPLVRTILRGKATGEETVRRIEAVQKRR